MPKTYKLARSPFLGHPVSIPPPLREASQSPQQWKQVSIFPDDIPASQPPDVSHGRQTKKHKRQGKTILNPPAIDRGITGFFDGAFARGCATFGVVVYSNGERIHRAAGPVISNTGASCNTGEYQAVIECLRYLQREGHTTATVYGDSKMVVQQLNGRWKARAGLYMPFYNEAIELRRALPDVLLLWTNRENNTEADALSKRPFLL